MRNTIAIFLLLCYASALSAQSDIAIRVTREKPIELGVYPDSMYFDSHSPRSFRIIGIPPGCRAKGSFTGGDLHIHNDQLDLLPAYVVRDTDLTPLERKYFSDGFKIIKGAYYVADLDINVFDTTGKLIRYLRRKCYIKYGSHSAFGNFEISAESQAPGAKGILKLKKDSAGAGSIK